MIEQNSKIEYLGDPIKTTFILDCVQGKEEGKDVLYFSVTGNPSTFVVYDVNEKKMIRTILHESDKPVKCIWTQKKDNFGNIFVGDAGVPAAIFKYDVSDKTLKQVASLGDEHGVYHLSCDEENNLYFGTAMGGTICKYDDKTGKLTNYGMVAEGEKYVMSSVYFGGKLYCGSRSDNPKFYSFDPKTKEVVYIDFPERIKGNVNAVYYMTLVRHFAFIIMKMNDGVYLTTCYNIKDKKWENVYEPGLGGQHLTEEFEGKSYFVGEDGYVKGICLDTLECFDTGIMYYHLEKGDDGFDYANGFMNGGFFKLKDQEKYPGYTYITSNYDNNSLAYVNFIKKETEFVNSGTILSKPIQIKALTSTASGNIVMGGYMSTKGILYDPDKNTYEEFYCRQTEGMTTVKDKTYFGVYTRASIWEFDENKPFEKEVNPKTIFQVGDHQDRPFAMCSGGDNLIIGTIPDYYELGGSLCVYNPDTKEKKMWRNLIKNQSITGVCERNGIIYASTGIWGGLSTSPVEKEAKIFSFDPEKGEIIKEATVKFPFEHGDILHIGGLLCDSDNNLWAVTSGTVFKFDPDTLEVTDYVNISGINWNRNITVWKPFSLVEKDEFIYSNPDEQLVRINKNTLEVEKYNIQAFMLAKGKDNKIYFCEGDSLYRCE